MKLYLSEVKQSVLEKKLFLLKLTDGHETGLSSLASWPSLGDPTLEQLKADLLNDQKLDLTRKALFFAIKDLRNENLKSLSIPKSHKLLLDEYELLQENDFFKIKLKPKNDFKTLAKILNSIELKKSSLRIDFNNKLKNEEFFEFLNLCTEQTMQSIDFIEDPFLYNETLWLEVKNKYPMLKLAIDHSDFINGKGFDVFIWKPAKNFYSQKAYKIIPTHYMSHEVEWFCSLWEASLHNKLFEEYCGFGTEHLNLNYKPGDKITINKNWNQNIKSYSWDLQTEDFQLAFELP